MITPDYVRTMAAYNAEMNRRVYAAAGRLGEAARRADRGAFWGSIHGTLAHLLWADRIWLSRFGVGEAPSVGLADSGGLVADWETLAAARGAFDGVITDWAAGLGDDALAGDLRWFSGAVRREMTRPRALCVAHVFNHQTHHRGQVHAMLTAAGEDTGSTDMVFLV